MQHGDEKGKEKPFRTMREVRSEVPDLVQPHERIKRFPKFQL